MTLAICLFLYFAPPIASMFITPQMAIHGRVWLFNLVWLFAWPILILFLPLRTR
jgi:hypothetical protein